MEKEETTSRESLYQGRYNEACRCYIKLRIKGLIFSLISLAALMIMMFVPSVNVSGEKYYIEYANIMRSLYTDIKNDNDTENMQQDGKIRGAVISFTLELLIGDEEDEAYAEKVALSSKLSYAMLNWVHFAELAELSDEQFKDTIAKEAKEYASLSSTYSMYEMGTRMWGETFMSKLFDRNDEKVYIFYHDGVGAIGVLVAYIITVIVLFLTALDLVMQLVLLLLTKSVVKSTYAHKNDNGRKKRRSAYTNFVTCGLLFYIAIVILHLISRAAKVSNPCALFYVSITLSPLLYVMLAIEAVVWVISLTNKATAKNAYFKSLVLL